MPNRISPIRKPDLFLLDSAPPARTAILAPRYIRIRPHALDDFVFLRARKELGDVGEEAVDFVRRMDYDAAMGEWEGECDVPAVGGA